MIRDVYVSPLICVITAYDFPVKEEATTAAIVSIVDGMYRASCIKLS